uniref:Uncharacterized protein n=1 Tax=Plectus sambesii TaxID=2011161 RepID=A0A914WSL2_9BILA
MNTKLVVVAFMCVVIGLSSALQCNTGTAPMNRNSAPLRKVNYPSAYKCCYKYAEVKGATQATFGAIPPNLSKKGCPYVGKCFYDYQVTHKNVCICENADDANCQPGPIKLSEDASSSAQSPK